MLENKVRVSPIKTNSSCANDDWTEPLEEEVLFFLAPTRTDQSAFENFLQLMIWTLAPKGKKGKNLKKVCFFTAYSMTEYRLLDGNVSLSNAALLSINTSGHEGGLQIWF